MSEIINRPDRSPGPLDPFLPTNASEAMRMATMLASSGLLGRGTPPKPESVLLLMARGHALGMAVGQSLFAFHIIDGVPTLKAESQQALCLSHPEICEEFAVVETTTTKATFRAKRRGHEPVTMSYSWDDAATAELTTGQNAKTWAKNPAAMLRARCITALGQVVFPDLLLGLSSPEEQAEIAEARGAVIEHDPATGAPVPETPEQVASRARRDQVHNDLASVSKGNGDEVKDRIATQEEAKEEVQRDPAKFTGTSSEIPAGPKADPWPENEPESPPKPPSGGGMVLEEEPTPPAQESDGTLRENVAQAVEKMTVDERRKFFEGLTPPMSYQSPAIIRGRLGIGLVEKLAAHLAAVAA
jgi:hypothetical protein